MYITYIIIGVTVAVSMLAFSRPVMFAELMMNPHKISTQGQYYRFITSGFIHQDHMHLIMNMFSFYFFGRVIEHIFAGIFGAWGAVYYIALYLLAIIVSDIPSYLKNRNNPRYNSLGASGGVAAVIFASIIFQPLQYICIFIAFCLPGFILGTAYIIYSYYQGKKANDNINHDAHLYGALFGFLFCAIMYPASIPNFFKEIMAWRIFD
ncbi:rhomboid family intramembrane serine protease [Chryseolinea sp. H1M3-3]|uniref:rhomboid family intramembrane serine protease n=1 Tax=Chryseolinea sp. H1M3-3 TaxID=3034144 RepID=UPI0023EB0D41|nr:rhomboid family intramembrane serine protease [Chryseolinea sp. H1M3-3]